MKIISVTQARTGSTRLPNKVLMEVQGVSLLEMHFRRLFKCTRIDEFVLATSVLPNDAKLKMVADKLGINFFQGDENNVLDRFYQAVKDMKPDYVVRLTADCPLIDPSLVDAIIEYTIENNLDYGTNTLVENYPDGQDVEVFTFKALEKAWREATKDSEKEHVTPYIKNNSTFLGKSLFKSNNYSKTEKYSSLRMTVDEKEDFLLIEKLVQNLGCEQSWQVYADFMLSEKLNFNTHIKRNEGYFKSLKKDLENDK